MDVKNAITVKRSSDEVDAFWHNFENLPRFMKHLESVAALAPEGESAGRQIRLSGTPRLPTTGRTS